MDHRISKDMISSGMIPSGEKNQEDLSRTQYGTAPSPNALSDVYKKMYEKKEETLNEHHQKDKDGNTIPHEDEEIKEGKMPAGLQTYLDKKKGKKEIKEEVDTYDIVLNHFLNEGYEKEDIIKVMSTVHLTEEPITATLALIGGKLAAGAAKVAAGGMKAAKAVGTATKPLATKAASQFGKVQNIAKAKPKVSPGQMSLDLKGAGMKDAGQKVPTPKSPSEVVDPKERLRRAASDMASGTPKTDKNRTGTRTAGESADLFDIVKGQLLDEGLSEEEIKDIMLTLTPDEILAEMDGKATPEAGTGKYYDEKNPTPKQKEIQKNLPQNRKPTPEQQAARDKYAKIKDMTNKGDHQGASKLYNS